MEARASTWLSVVQELAGEQARTVMVELARELQQLLGSHITVQFETVIFLDLLELGTSDREAVKDAIHAVEGGR